MQLTVTGKQVDVGDALRRPVDAVPDAAPGSRQPDIKTL